MSRRSALPLALRSEDFALPAWMEFGFHHMRIPDEYWKFFPDIFQHRFAFADWIERRPINDHVVVHGARLLRQYLIEEGVIPPNSRLRFGEGQRVSEAAHLARRYFGADFVEVFSLGRIPHEKQWWANKARSMRAPLEFAQPEELGNVWPEALIAQVQLDFHFKSSVFEEHRMTPEKQAEEDYHNALSDAKWFNEHIDRFIMFLRNQVQQRKIRPMLFVRKWATTPRKQHGLGIEYKPYDHSLLKNLPTFVGPRAWHFLSSFQDSKTRKHTTIGRDELIRRLEDERPVPPEPPELPDHLKQNPEAPVIFDEEGNIIPVRFDAGRDCWVDDFGDPVSVEKNDE